MPKRNLYQNQVYHIYNRSFSGDSIFLSEKDYARFLLKLSAMKKDYLSIRIMSFCILPNHFHFIVQDFNPGVDDEEVSLRLSKFFGVLQNSYAKYFNIKNKKKGPVFDGRFKSKAVLDESYLEKLKIYVEWNAVKHGFVKLPEEWLYTSYSKVLTAGINIEDDFDSFFD